MSEKLNNLLFLGMDNAGLKKTMTLSDALRLVISSYKLGYQDGVNDSKDILNEKDEQQTPDTPLPS
jgi:hypothetical protein